MFTTPLDKFLKGCGFQNVTPWGFPLYWYFKSNMTLEYNFTKICTGKWASFPSEPCCVLSLRPHEGIGERVRNKFVVRFSPVFLVRMEFF